MATKHKHKFSHEEKEDHIPGVLWSYVTRCECGAVKRTAELAKNEVVEAETPSDAG